MSRGTICFFSKEIVVELERGLTIIPSNPKKSLTEGRPVDLQPTGNKYTHFAAVADKAERTHEEWRKELPLRTPEHEAKLKELLAKRKACLEVSKLSSDYVNADKALNALNAEVTALLNDALPDKFYEKYPAYAPEVFSAWMDASCEQESHSQDNSASMEVAIGALRYKK